MKTKPILTAGLIASTTLIQVHGIESESQRDRGRSSQTVTVTYREPAPANPPSLFGGLSESDIRCLEHGGLQLFHVLNGGTAQKNTVHVIHIEAHTARIGAAPDREPVREYVMSRPQGQPEQVNWFNPRQVLLKWAELWSGDHGVPYVLLVHHEF